MMIVVGVRIKNPTNFYMIVLYKVCQKQNVLKSHPIGLNTSLVYQQSILLVTMTLAIPEKNLWPPHEGTAPAPPEDSNPYLKRLMDVSESQDTVLEDNLLLCNRFNIHRCSDYCMTTNKHKSEKDCRMGFGSENESGRQLVFTP